MLVEVKVPVLSESVAEATLVSWHKEQGEYVDRDENLIDVETDKVVLELPAPSSGVLVEIIKKNGETVGSAEIIARIETEAKAAVDNAKDNSPKKSEGNDPPSKKEVKESTSSILMPAAKKLAEENNLHEVDISKINGTGLDGRISLDDVKSYLRSKPTTNTPSEKQSVKQIAKQVPTDSSSNREDRSVPMSRLRMRIAERLIESQSTAAILTTFNEVNMQAVIELRNRYRKSFESEHSVKLGFTSFFVKAIVAGLKKFPILNASVDGQDIIYHDYYDIGIAVGSPRGLVVPILRDADQLSTADIEKQIADFARRAQNGKLTIEELTGGTFSMTNGGVFGSMLSTPIINPPQSAILGIHATKDRPVVENGQIVIRPMNYLALSYDHRIIDGREAVLSLMAIKEGLEYPVSPLYL